MFDNIKLKEEFCELIEPYELLLDKEASERQRDIMIVKAKRLLDGRDFILTDFKDLFLKNYARHDKSDENHVEVLKSIFIEGNPLIISNKEDTLIEGNDGLSVIKR